jgi:uncharacterized protein
VREDASRALEQALALIMKISIDQLKTLPQQRLSIDYNETLSGLETVKPVVGRLTVSLSISGMRLSGQVKTLLKLNCHRCLRPYFQSLSIEMDERFVDEQELPIEGELLKDDFVEAIPPDGMLDISDIVYQAVTLATPTTCLCGAECPGPPHPQVMAPPHEESSHGIFQAGTAASEASPVDPRWKNLKTLFSKGERKENS